MTEPNPVANEHLVLTDMVDELIEFTDKAVQHSTEPEHRLTLPSAGPILSDVEILAGRYSMNDVMTTAEMESRFPSEWILIGDPQTDQYLRVLSGTVLWHSKDRDEVYRKAIELPAPKHFATLYTGPIPSEGTATALPALTEVVNELTEFTDRAVEGAGEV